MDGISYTVQEYGPNRLRLAGSFRPNGSSAVSAANNKGKWFAVARSSQGLFAVTFADTVIDLEAFFCHLRLASAAARWAQGGTWTSATRIKQIRVVDGSGNVQDIADNADNVISFEAIVRIGGDW